MDFNEGNTWTTILGLCYINPSHLSELLEKLDKIQIIADPREKLEALVKFIIECRKLSACEQPYPNADHFRYGDLNALLEDAGGVEALHDPSARLRTLLRLRAESQFFDESD